MAAGCSQFSTDGISLTTDTSVEILAPADRTSVGLPLEVRWSDDAPVPGGGYLVVIDRAPMPPGETAEWFARDDPDCAVNPGCPDELWLARRGITPSADPAVTIEIVPAREDSRPDAYYDLTVVRLDAEGRRYGEAAYHVQFRLEGS